MYFRFTITQMCTYIDTTQWTKCVCVPQGHCLCCLFTEALLHTALTWLPAKCRKKHWHSAAGARLITGHSPTSTEKCAICSRSVSVSVEVLIEKAVLLSCFCGVESSQKQQWWEKGCEPFRISAGCFFFLSQIAKDVHLSLKHRYREPHQSYILSFGNCTKWSDIECVWGGHSDCAPNSLG